MSYVKERIAAINNYREVKDLQYPANPAQGDWFFYTNCSSSWDQADIAKKYLKHKKETAPSGTTYFNAYDEDHVSGIVHYQIGHYGYAYLCIKRQGDSTNVTLGNACITAKDFPEKWKELVCAAKERVDRLNSMDIAMGLTSNVTICVQCDNPALEDDYLCGDCRGS